MKFGVKKFAKNCKPVPQDVMSGFEMLDLGLITRTKEKAGHSLFAIILLDKFINSFISCGKRTHLAHPTLPNTKN